MLNDTNNIHQRVTHVKLDGQLPHDPFHRGIAADEGIVIAQLCWDGDFAQRYASTIDPELFADPTWRLVLKVVTEDVAKYGEADTERIKEAIESSDPDYTHVRMTDLTQYAGFPAFSAERSLERLVERRHAEALAAVCSRFYNEVGTPAMSYEEAMERLDSIRAVHSTLPATGPMLVTMSDVQPEPVRWLWPDRIPLGKLTLFAGDPNLGKSFLTLDIAARVSSGTPWPDDPGASNRPGGVLLLSAEDDVADTIRPRLDAAGADVTRIHVLQAVTLCDPETGTERVLPFCLQSNLDSLQCAIEQIPDCRLVVIDPLTAYLGRTDSYKNAEVRGLLAPVAALAAKHRVAVLGVTHLNKSSGGKALYRATGSLAFVAAARSVWFVGKDRDDPRRRFLLPVKLNIAPDPTGLAYAIQPCLGDPAVACVAWERDPVSVTADEVLAAEGRADPDEQTARQDAVEWLRAALADGPLPADEVRKQARINAIAEATLRRAKTDAGVESYKGTGSDPRWYWRLKRDAQGQGAQDDPPQDVSALSALSTLESFQDAQDLRPALEPAP